MKQDESWEIISAKVIQKMKDDGLPPWVRTWDAGPAFPTNFETKKAYSGRNFIELSMAPHRSPYFLTYLQVKTLAEAMARDGVPPHQLPHVRRGERGYTVIKPTKGSQNDLEEAGDKQPTGSSSSDPKGSAKTKRGRSQTQGASRTGLQRYTVFNAEQIENFPEQPVLARPEFVPLERAERFIQAWKDQQDVETRVGGDRPYYSPASDHIQMPPRESFIAPEHFYVVWAHEAAHSSGHPSRNARDLTGVFGSRLYSREEGVADMTGALLTGEMGIPLSEFQLQQTAIYCKGWIKAFAEDPLLLRGIVKDAFAAAQLVMDNVQAWELANPAILNSPEPSDATVALPELASSLAAQAGARYSGPIVAATGGYLFQQWGAEQVRHDAARLERADLRKGDRVLIVYPSNPEAKAKVKPLSLSLKAQGSLAL